jgi:peptidoglycan/xylan/chitin deacetylase (PgdA/CDA1 family)
MKYIKLSSFALIVFSSCVWAKVINRLPTQEKVVCLTFDDGPSPKTTPKVLAILKKYNVPATFFVLGQCAKRSPDLLATIVNNGHTLANHSYFHKVMPSLTAEQQNKELEETNKLLAPVSGDPQWFRPPYGSCNPALKARVESKGMKVVLWSIDPLDWKKPSPAVLKKRVSDHLHPGAIILLHDIHASTVKGLEGVIQAILKKGYRIVPLSYVSSPQ